MEKESLLKKVEFLHKRDLYLYNLSCIDKVSKQSILKCKNLLNCYYKTCNTDDILRLHIKNIFDYYDYKNFCNCIFLFEKIPTEKDIEKVNYSLNNDNQTEIILDTIKKFNDFIKDTEKDIKRNFIYDTGTKQVKYNFEFKNKNLTETEIHSIMATEILIFESIDID